MNVLKNDLAMEVIHEAAEKLRALGVVCAITPVDFADYGMCVSLHAGPTELAVSAACVAEGEGSIPPHLMDESERNKFASLVADYIAGQAIYHASRPPED